MAKTGGRGTETPLKVAREIGRAANSAARIVEREQLAAEGTPPADEELPPLTPAEADIVDELDAIEDELAGLEGDQPAILEIFALESSSTSNAPRPVNIGILENLRGQPRGYLRNEMIRLAQRAGRWGDVHFRVGEKRQFVDQFNRTRWRYAKNVYPWIFVERTEAAERAAAATSAGTAAAGPQPLGVKDVFDVAEKIAGKPAQPADPVETFTRVITAGKELGVIPESAKSEDLTTKLVALVPAIKAVVEMVRPAPAPSLLETMMVLGQLGLLKGAGGGSSLSEALKVVELILDRTGGSEGERSVWGEIKDVLTGLLDRPAVQNFSTALLERVRASSRPAPAGPAIAAPAAPAPAGQDPRPGFYQELQRAADQDLHGYFPALAQRIRDVFPQGGPEILGMVSADANADEPALSRLAEAFGDVNLRLTPTMQTFLRTFCNWLRYERRRGATGTPAPAPAAAPTNGSGRPDLASAAPPVVTVNARCPVCQTKYGFESELHFAEDSKLCDAPREGGGVCGGMLVREEGAP